MTTYHLENVVDIYDFVRSSGMPPLGRPLKRILHLLFRKGMAETLFVEQNAFSKEYADECKAYGKKDDARCMRFHFFAGNFKESEIEEKARKYFGYCDVRPDGTLAKAAIADEVIIRPDTYTCLVCRMEEVVTLPSGHTVKVVGFPYIEKDGGVMMCSQAAVANLVAYWNTKHPGSFDATTALEISEKVGKAPETLQIGNHLAGLNTEEIRTFFETAEFNCQYEHFWSLTERQRIAEDPSVILYGYLESGFPVIAIVGTSDTGRIQGEVLKAKGVFEAEGILEHSNTISLAGARTLRGSGEFAFSGNLRGEGEYEVQVQTKNEELHALTIVGHTFDKNIWTALANPLYFSSSLSGGEGERNEYHSNLEWIKYFIVQDDNFGPYFFLPREILPRIIRALIVPVPYAAVKVSPKVAERAAFVAIQTFTKEFGAYGEQRFDGILERNRFWLKVFFEHMGGWVLRSMLSPGKDIAASYVDSEFFSEISEVFNDPKQLHWRVEISWPNLFCYQESQVGEVIIDATLEKVKLFKLPGILMLPERRSSPWFSSAEDAPYKHPKPAVAFHLAQRDSD